MKIARVCAVVAVLAAVTLVLVALPAPPASAQSAPLRVIVANAAQAVMAAVQPQCEQAIGRPLQIQYETSAGITRAVNAGTALYDVFILNAASMDAMVQNGTIVPASRVDFARTTLGVGVRAGGPVPDVSTADSLKKALLAAKTIAYPKEGSSTPYILKLFDRLGIADQIKSKTMPEVSTRDAVIHVVDGQADIFVSLISEIIPAKGIRFAGRVPAEFQGDLRFSAGVASTAANAASAQALIRYLMSPAIVPALEAEGMEPAQNAK